LIAGAPRSSGAEDQPPPETKALDRAVLLWNLSEQRQALTLRYGEAHRPVSVNGLDVALIEGIDA
jgi:hypothetical protein